MKSKVISKLLIAALCGLAYTPAFAFYVNVLECRVTGGAQNLPNFTMNGPAVSSGKSTAGPLRACLETQVWRSAISRHATKTA